MKSALVQVRVDEETKRCADALFSDLGMDTATAIRVFLRQAIKTRSLPFDVRQHPQFNALTEAAFAEGDAIADGRVDAASYGSWADFAATLDDG
jgi:DNA-damage-inducible protein J